MLYINITKILHMVCIFYCGWVQVEFEVRTKNNMNESQENLYTLKPLI